MVTTTGSVLSNFVLPFNVTSLSKVASEQLMISTNNVPGGRSGSLPVETVKFFIVPEVNDNDPPDKSLN